jgi:hypothetical protein
MSAPTRSFVSPRLGDARPEEGDSPNLAFERRRAGWPRGSAVAPRSHLRPLRGRLRASRSTTAATRTSPRAPRLLELRFPAAFFVNPATVGQRGRLCWPHVERLAAAHAHRIARSTTPPRRPGPGEIERPECPGGLERGWGRRSRSPRGDRGRLPRGRRRPATASSSAPSRRWAGVPALSFHAVRQRHGLEGFRAAVEQRPGFRLVQALRHRALQALRSVIGSRAYVRWAQRVAPPRGDGDGGLG